VGGSAEKWDGKPKYTLMHLKKKNTTKKLYQKSEKKKTKTQLKKIDKIAQGKRSS